MSFLDGLKKAVHDGLQKSADAFEAKVDAVVAVEAALLLPAPLAAEAASVVDAEVVKLVNEVEALTAPPVVVVVVPTSPAVVVVPTPAGSA